MKAALLAERQRGVKKRFVQLKVQAGAADAPFMSTLWHGGEVVGETTSGAGHRVGASLALGMLRADLAVPGTAIEVEIFGQRFAAEVLPDVPAWIRRTTASGREAAAGGLPRTPGYLDQDEKAK